MVHNNAMTKKYKYDIDDYKVVMHILRHHCERVRKVERAIEIVVKRSGFSEEKVSEIVREIFKED